LGSLELQEDIGIKIDLLENFYLDPIITPWYSIGDRWNSRVPYPAQEGDFVWTESANLRTDLRNWTPCTSVVKRVLESMVRDLAGRSSVDPLISGDAPLNRILTANKGGAWDPVTETWVGGTTYSPITDFIELRSPPVITGLNTEPFIFASDKILSFKLDRFVWIKVSFPTGSYTASEVVDLINAAAGAVHYGYLACASLGSGPPYNVLITGVSTSDTPHLRMFVEVHLDGGSAELGIVGGDYVEETSWIDWSPGGSAPSGGDAYLVVYEYVTKEFN
jgi:hypothetical protein